MRTLGLIVVLTASLAFAQGNTGQSTTGISRGNGLRIPQYQTTATATWFLDPAGVDTNTCTSASSPCQTILGLQAKMPKVIRNPTTITMAAGSYAGGWFSDFQFAPTAASAGAYIALVGSLTSFSPATGTASGTASAGATCALGPPLTDATLTDGTQTWTVNNLRGQLIEITGGTGSGQIIPIDSNTATVITIAGCWSGTPNATSTYAIRTWASIINSTVQFPADYVSAAGGSVGLNINNIGGSDDRSNQRAFFYVDSVRVQITSSVGSLVVLNANVSVLRSRFDTTSGPGVSVDGSTRLQFQQSVATSNTLAALGLFSFYAAPPALRVVNSYFESGTTSGTVLSLPGTMYSGGNLISNSFARATNSGAQSVLFLNASSSSMILSGLRLVCTTGGTTSGLLANSSLNSTPFFPAGPFGINFDSCATRECPTGISLGGQNTQMTTDDSTFQATAGTAAISLSNGAVVNLDANSAISGAFTNELVLDATTATFADVASSGPIRNASFGTAALPTP